MSISNMWLDLKSRVSSVGSKFKRNELFYYFSFSSINSIHLLRAYTINIIALTVGNLIGWILDPNRVQAKNVKIYSYCCFVRWVT